MEKLDIKNKEIKLSAQLPERGEKCMFYLADGQGFEGSVNNGMHGPVISSEDYRKVYPYEKFNLIRGWRPL